MRWLIWFNYECKFIVSIKSELLFFHCSLGYECKVWTILNNYCWSINVKKTLLKNHYNISTLFLWYHICRRKQNKKNNDISQLLLLSGLTCENFNSPSHKYRLIFSTFIPSYYIICEIFWKYWKDSFLLHSKEKLSKIALP